MLVIATDDEVGSVQQALESMKMEPVLFHVDANLLASAICLSSPEVANPNGLLRRLPSALAESRARH